MFPYWSQGNLAISLIVPLIDFHYTFPLEVPHISGLLLAYKCLPHPNIAAFVGLETDDLVVLT